MCWVSWWFYGSSFCIPQTPGWKPFSHYPANHAPASASEPGNQSAGIPWDPWEQPIPVTNSQPPRLQQEGRDALHSPWAWETAAQFMLPYTLVLLIFLDEEPGLQAPGAPPCFRKGGFSGNPFCKFPSADDLRAALSELSNAGCRCRWCVDSHTLWLLCCSRPAK